MAFNSDNILLATNFRWRIELAQPNLTRDSFGGTKVDDATVFAEVWASVEAAGTLTSLKGREIYAAQQRVSQVSHLVTIRYLDGVKANMLVWFRDREFQIQAVIDPDEQQKVLFLLCLERDDSANEAPPSPVTT
jgi:SPP1 family predicted phage head-tail adaptor